MPRAPGAIGGSASPSSVGGAAAPPAAAPSGPTAEEACRAQFDACWLTGDYAGCIGKAHDCGLFPQGVDAGIACYTDWTLCIVQLGFNFAECARRVVPCGLLPESALACADRMDACIARGPSIPKCWEEGAMCGVFPGGRVPETM